MGRSKINYMRNIHNGHYRPSRKLAARIASLMTFVMIVSDCLPGLAAVPERTFGRMPSLFRMNPTQRRPEETQLPGLTGSGKRRTVFLMTRKQEFLVG